jgi:hypothetical protein
MAAIVAAGELLRTARHYLSAGPTGIDDISSFQRVGEAYFGEAYFSTSGYGAATIESSDACTFAVSNTQS